MASIYRKLHESEMVMSVIKVIRVLFIDCNNKLNILLLLDKGYKKR